LANQMKNATDVAFLSHIGGVDGTLHLLSKTD